MDTNLISRIPSRYFAYISLLIWGVIAALLLRQDAYSLDEGASKALLFVWTVADQVASSVVTFGAPDLRILLFAPVGFLWTGNVFAAKIFTLFSLAFVSWLFYSWEQARADSECALIATGLLLISPLTLCQIDTLSPGVYLLLSFVLGAWLDKAYRAAPFHFGGWYFAQLFVCALSVSMHSAGLAYPFALLWTWYKNPIDHKQQKYFYVGIGFVVLAMLIMRMGWNDLLWMQNPLSSLSDIALGSALNNEMSVARWIVGSVLMLLVMFVIFKQFCKLWEDFTGRTLFIGLVLGTTTSDTTWAMIALCIILYFGFPMLLRQQPSPGGGLMRQRGVTLFILIILCTVFMRADRAHYALHALSADLGDQELLIRALSDEAEHNRKATEESGNNPPPTRLRVASQWPSRTMIACKCDTLPLPPASKDPQTQLTMMHSITYLLFNPKQTSNVALARNLAILGGDIGETVALQPGGVLLHLK